MLDEETQRYEEITEIITFFAITYASLLLLAYFMEGL